MLVGIQAHTPGVMVVVRMKEEIKSSAYCKRRSNVLACYKAGSYVSVLLGVLISRLNVGQCSDCIGKVIRVREMITSRY